MASSGAVVDILEDGEGALTDRRGSLWGIVPMMMLFGCALWRGWLYERLPSAYVVMVVHDLAWSKVACLMDSHIKKPKTAFVRGFAHQAMLE